jgi:hypothetical protein
MKESWQNLIDLIANPGAVFERLKSNPKWVLAFVLFFSLSVGLAWANAPFIERLMSLLKPDVAATISFKSYVVKGSVVVVLWCIILSATFAIAAGVFKVNSALKFKHVYAAVVHTSLIGTLIYLINIGLFPLFRQLEDINRPIDMKLIPGLHMLAGSIENPHILTFLSHINPLSVWYVGVLTIAVVILAEVNRVKACFTALIIFFIRIGTEILFFNLIFY